MPTVTATQIIGDAFQTLNVYLPADIQASPWNVSTADSTTALRFLNLMIGQWAQQRLTIPAELRFVFPLVAGKGSSTNPYSIGAGGDLSTPKPPNQNSVVAAGLLLNASTPAVEIPRGLMTNDAYEAQRIKDLTSPLFTSVYYLPTFANSLGSLYLWPVPLDLTNSGVLYILAGLTQFADLTTSYSIPDGYDDALYKCLMATTGFARAFGRTVDADLKAEALESKRIIERSNIQMSDLANDFASIGVGHARKGYNLQTGE